MLLVSVLFVTSLLLLVWWFLRKEVQLHRLNLIGELRKEIVPQKIQAYERLTLLLERISPEALVLREQKNSLNSMQFHSLLLKLIRQEFEHNLAMQIYLPSKTWLLVVKAREEIVKLINTSAASVNPQQPSLELGRTIIDNAPSKTKYHINKALTSLRADIDWLFQGAK